MQRRIPCPIVSRLPPSTQAVGYNAAEKYWIVRNSWNTDWGDKGYIYVKEGMDACGIAKDATIVKGASATEAESEAEVA